MKSHILLMLFLVFLFSACTKSPGKTEAKIKINMGNLINASTGLGEGGTILYGRSHLGHLFGKVINAASETIEVPNGNWVFYAFTWAGTTPAGVTAGKLMGRVYCAKTAQSLNGGDVSIALNLSNANCADPEFSEGRIFDDSADPGNKRFALNYLEECDDLSGTDFKCGLKNQGSGRSYRVKIQGFKKGPGTNFIFEENSILSNCRRATTAGVSDGIAAGSMILPVNFPSGSLLTPFVATIEVFLGSDDCGVTPDPKGVYQLTLMQGFRSQNPIGHKVLFSSKDGGAATVTLGGTTEQIKQICNDLLSSSGATNCTGIPAGISNFAPDTLVPAVATPLPKSSIKHMIQVPRPFLCDRYLNTSTQIGDNPFAGGLGYKVRPYKICNEWQINQIGETSAPASFASSHYKLMNDLDMNRADFGPYAKPGCVGVINSVVDRHHNLNSLDKITSDCISEYLNPQFTGSFDGNGKIIRNARIAAEGIDQVGFVRQLYGGAITNLNFKRLEVRGKMHIGGLAGIFSGGATSPLLANINLEDIEIEGATKTAGFGSYVGGAVGLSALLGSRIENVHIKSGVIRGNSSVGGLAGENLSNIKNSSFRGNIKVEYQVPLAGGITSKNLPNATIENTFSEGIMVTAADASGGIAGENQGTILNSYSTMNLHYVYGPGGSRRIGGIAGTNNAGSISNVYSDGALTFSSFSAPMRGGIVGTNLNSGTATNCYTIYSNDYGGCTTNTNPNSLVVSTAFSDPTQWQKITNSYPRLAGETRECLSLNNQISVSAQVSTLARGGALEPVSICNASQLIEISNSTLSFRLLEDINLSSWTNAQLISNFGGTLFGNDKILYGLNVQVPDATDPYVGIFKSIASTGKLKKFNLYGNNLVNFTHSGEQAAGLLAGVNGGEIHNIEMIGNHVDGNYNVGLAAGINSGSINSTHVIQSSSQGVGSIGGIAGLNNSGSIQKVSFRGDVLSYSAASLNYSKFGGIAGVNSALIDQAQMSGKIKVMNSTIEAQMHAGGIVGVLNTSGVISNSFSDKEAEISVPYANSVGGLVGETIAGAFITKSFSVGKVIYSAGLVDVPLLDVDYFHPLVGKKAAGTVDSTVFYLNNTWGASKGSFAVSSTDCTAGTPNTCTMSSATIGNLFSTQYGGDSVGFTPVNYIIDNTHITYAGSQAFPANTNLNFYQSSPLINTTGQLELSSFANIDTFCSSWSTDGNGCTSGFDIVKEGQHGTNRLYSYYEAMLNRNPIPANSPIWDLDDEGYPRLLQVRDH